MPASTDYCPGCPSPLPDRAGLIRPRKLGNKLALPHYRAPTFHAGFAVIELAALADGEPASHLFVTRPWGTGCDMLNCGGGEVGGLLEQARPGDGLRSRVCGVRLVHRDGIAVLADDARADLAERVSALAAALLKVIHAATDHGSGLHLPERQTQNMPCGQSPQHAASNSSSTALGSRTKLPVTGNAASRWQHEHSVIRWPHFGM